MKSWVIWASVYFSVPELVQVISNVWFTPCLPGVFNTVIMTEQSMALVFGCVIMTEQSMALVFGCIPQRQFWEREFT